MWKKPLDTSDGWTSQKNRGLSHHEGVKGRKKEEGRQQRAVADHGLKGKKKKGETQSAGTSIAQKKEPMKSLIRFPQRSKGPEGEGSDISRSQNSPVL